MGLRVISFWQAFGCLVFAPALTLTRIDSRKSKGKREMINGRDKLEDDVESQFAAQSFAQDDRQLKRGGACRGPRRGIGPMEPLKPASWLVVVVDGFA